MMHDKAVLFKLALCLGMLGHQAGVMPIASSKLRISTLCHNVVGLLILEQRPVYIFRVYKVQSLN